MILKTMQLVNAGVRTSPGLLTLSSTVVSGTRGQCHTVLCGWLVINAHYVPLDS